MAYINKDKVLFSATVNLGSPESTQSKTVTPSTSQQTVTPDEGYSLASVTVEAVTSAIDNNITAENIKKDVSILGVTGTLESGGGEELAGVIQGTVTEINDTNGDISNIRSYAFYGCSNLETANFPSCTSIGDHAFQNCYSLTTISFPMCTSISSYAFQQCSALTTASFLNCSRIASYAFNNCSRLTTANFPACTGIGTWVFANCYSLTTASFPACSDIGASAFVNCRSLTSIYFPACTYIQTSAFSGCSALTTASFPVCTSIGYGAFYSCKSLSALYLTKSATLGGAGTFSLTPMSNSTYLGYYGSIYVPESLLSWYQTATNWVTYSSRITTFTPAESE